MASGFFALLDDISTLMDDIASSAKIATQKTVGVLGDDLAINAKNASNFTSSRELPVLWAIIKGSFINKLILLPFVFLLSTFLPWAITPLLILGGIYLSFEGAEKIYEYFFHKKHINKEVKSSKTDEKKKIKDAIRTDFVLSIEIVILATSSVKNYPLYIQLPVVAIVSFIATIGVYGIVAIIIRMDDMGIKLIGLSKNKNKFLKEIGLFLIKSMPITIKILSFIGTLAMIMVAGNIFINNIKVLHNLTEYFPSILSEFITGIVSGSIFLILAKIFKPILSSHLSTNK